MQAILERDGRVVNIRWANRLVVMPYPDEGGHHLEVINFKNGFGALQVRDPKGGPFDASLYPVGKHDKPAAAPIITAGDTLFIVPAGSYDLQVRARGKTTWQSNLEVPLDRTRLSVIELLEEYMAIAVRLRGQRTPAAGGAARRRARHRARIAAEGCRPAHQHPDHDRLVAVHADVDRAGRAARAIPAGSRRRSSPASAFSAPGRSCAPGQRVQGLTTAATIWVNAAIGVAAGGGEYHLAVDRHGRHARRAPVALRRSRNTSQRPFGTAEVEPKKRRERRAKTMKKDSANFRRIFRGTRAASTGSAGVPPVSHALGDHRRGYRDRVARAGARASAAAGAEISAK